MPSASAAPSALHPTMLAASGGTVPYESAVSERGQPVPLQDVPSVSAEPIRGEAIPLQDAARSAPPHEARAIVPSTPPRTSHDVREPDGPRTRTPPGTVAKAIAKFSPAVPSVPKSPQVFPMTPPRSQALAPRSSPIAAVVQNAGGTVSVQDLLDLDNRLREWVRAQLQSQHFQTCTLFQRTQRPS